MTAGKGLAPSLPQGLLATKPFAPRHRHSMLPRPQLVARLDAALDLPLTVVAAPAGSGKTSPVADWYASLDGREGRPRPLAQVWLSLDSGDNEPSTFARYLAAARRPW